MRVLVEVLVPEEHPADLNALSELLAPVSIRVDETFAPVGSGRADGDKAIFLIRGEIDEADRSDLEKHPNVHSVWNDTPVEPFGGSPNF